MCTALTHYKSNVGSLDELSAQYVTDIHCSVLWQEAIEAEVRKGTTPESARLARNISHMSMGSDGATPPQGNSSNNLMNLGAHVNSPYMSKLESVASSAVKAADKVGASLIIVFTNTGIQ